MELVGSLLTIFVGWIVLQAILDMAGRGAVVAGRAVKKVITGKETYFGPAELRVDDGLIPDSTFKTKEIMFRGRIPVVTSTNVSYVISVFDVTEGDQNLKPVLSLVDAAQEKNTIAYQVSGQIGDVDIGISFIDWVKIGIVIPELLQPPCSGEREIMVITRFHGTGSPPEINGGFLIDDGPIICSKNTIFTHYFSEKGYEEASKHREESQSLSLKIGIAVAMSDGDLDDSEGEVLKAWILKEIAGYSDEKQARLKTLFNDSLSEGFEKAEAGELVLTNLVSRLKEIGDKKTKYDAVELCLDIMAADDIAAPEEMQTIRKIAESLELDMVEIEKMREKVTLDLSSELTSEAGLESLVGIEQDWENAKKKKHLRQEFQKWSNRINSLSEGEERDSAQAMLDTIASLRKKYD